ncbi:hypothetical protein LLEC1_04683 [Akanthomyces lecanii]|uniref:Glycoside hydrolase family 71 protein n=1 Tax=Cordyceps confragosa TaxID=2714763 RepID=A0A179IIH7_CORDF|nr:hypothetical protein LLEC1_04683 [Akanthomyces lecanii]
MRVSLSAAAIVLLASRAAAKAVYAHYMLGGVSPSHAQIDVDQAKALGIDAFTVNIGETSQGWALNALEGLFAAAQKSNFKLFISMDFHQQPDINAFTKLAQKYVGHSAYLRIDNRPVISTFSLGGYSVDQIKSWTWTSLADVVYFVPNADTAPGYNDPSTFVKKWADAVDGFLGWETAWPGGGTQPANVSSSFDSAVMRAAHGVSKTYMAPLSSLQFKACCGEHWYRIGEVNLPQRMQQLVDLQPDMVEVLTWNDAGESHYIGNNWPETLGGNPEILAYSSNEVWPHTAWQPLIQSFITAYKGNGRFAPVNGASASGAMWYRTVLTTASCNKPSAWQSARDSVNYAIVFGDDVSNTKIRVTTNGYVLSEVAAEPGLNYAAVDGMRLGAQKVEVVKNGVVTLKATSTANVDNNSDCYFNYKVVGFE